MKIEKFGEVIGGATFNKIHNDIFNNAPDGIIIELIVSKIQFPGLDQSRAVAQQIMFGCFDVIMNPFVMSFYSNPNRFILTLSPISISFNGSYEREMVKHRLNSLHIILLYSHW